MGFYQPAQLLEQAKRQRVKVLPVDVTVSDYDCTLEPDGTRNFPTERPCLAIRLGMRLIKGLREDDARNVVAARAIAPFTSVEDVAYRAGLKSRAAKALATSGAFRSLSEHRNQAFWSALGIESLPGALAGHAAAETTPQLPIPTEWEEIQRDYRQMGLSTGRHPMAVLRPKLRASGIATRRELDSMRHGRTVRVGGLVTHLQHPQTANGVIFASLEDETGINNIIFWPAIFELYRQRILQSNFMVVTGRAAERGIGRARGGDRRGRLFPLGENVAAQVARLPLEEERISISAGSAQLIEVLGSHVLAKGFDGFGTLTLGSVHGGLGDFHIDDLGFDEPTAFERIHIGNP